MGKSFNLITQSIRSNKIFIISFILIFLFSFENLFGQFTPNGNNYLWTNKNVSIGINSSLAKLEVSLPNDFMYRNESGFRITYPVPQFIVGETTINQNIFQIRQNGLLGQGFSTKMVVKTNGNTGIGVTNPNSKLHVNGRIQISGNNSYGGPMLLFGGQLESTEAGQWGIEYIPTGVSGLNFWKPNGSNNFGNYFMFLADNGKVSIGLDPNEVNTFNNITYNGDYKLYVKTGILTEKVKIALRSSEDWADYVFNEDYNLLKLDEVEKHIKENGHLPNVPNAEEVFQKGIDVAKMDAKLLEKIEELTLYIIEQNKRLDSQEERIKKLELEIKR